MGAGQHALQRHHHRRVVKRDDRPLPVGSHKREGEGDARHVQDREGWVLAGRVLPRGERGELLFYDDEAAFGFGAKDKDVGGGVACGLELERMALLAQYFRLGRQRLYLGMVVDDG